MRYRPGLSEAAGVNKLVFSWYVADSHWDNDGFLIGPDALRNAGGITDWSGNAINPRLPGYWGNDKRFRVGNLGPPLVIDAAITSTPATGFTYRPGETVEFTLTASELLKVSPDNEPRLVINVGNDYPSARYRRGLSDAAGTNKLVFTWRVSDGHEDDDGILMLGDSLRNANGVKDHSGRRINANLQDYRNFYHHRVGR